MRVFSFGGGMGSWGVAAYVIAGLIPCPDLGIFVQLPYESPFTLAYLERHRLELPFPLHVITLEKMTLWSVNGRTFLPGGYVLGSGSFVRGFCSAWWKRAPVRRYLSRVVGLTDYVLMFGMHRGEERRTSLPRQRGVAHEYPLLEHGIGRDECCSAIVAAFGEPAPRSSCYICPGQTPDQWYALATMHPDLVRSVFDEIEPEANRAGFSLWREPVKERLLDMLNQEVKDGDQR